MTPTLPLATPELQLLRHLLLAAGSPAFDALLPADLPALLGVAGDARGVERLRAAALRKVRAALRKCREGAGRKPQ